MEYMIFFRINVWNGIPKKNMKIILSMVILKICTYLMVNRRSGGSELSRQLNQLTPIKQFKQMMQITSTHIKQNGSFKWMLNALNLTVSGNRRCRHSQTFLLEILRWRRYPNFMMFSCLRVFCLFFCNIHNGIHKWRKLFNQVHLIAPDPSLLC